MSGMKCLQFPFKPRRAILPFTGKSNLLAGRQYPIFQRASNFLPNIRWTRSTAGRATSQAQAMQLHNLGRMITFVWIPSLNHCSVRGLNNSSSHTDSPKIVVGRFRSNAIGSLLCNCSSLQVGNCVCAIHLSSNGLIFH